MGPCYMFVTMKEDAFSTSQPNSNYLAAPGFPTGVISSWIAFTSVPSPYQEEDIILRFMVFKRLTFSFSSPFSSPLPFPSFSFTCAVKEITGPKCSHLSLQQQTRNELQFVFLRTVIFKKAMSNFLISTTWVICMICKIKP